MPELKDVKRMYFNSGGECSQEEYEALKQQGDRATEIADASPLDRQDIADHLQRIANMITEGKWKPYELRYHPETTEVTTDEDVWRTYKPTGIITITLVVRG